MFRHIAAFEFRYHLRSPVFWTTTLLFGLLTFGAITSDQVQIGSTGNVKKNSPFAIANTLEIMSIFAVFIMAAFVSNVRDDETGYGPIVHSTRLDVRLPVRPVPGAFVVGCLAFASVPLAMLIGSFMPWIDPTLGPLRPGDYVRLLRALRADAADDGRVLFRTYHDDAFDADDVCRRRSAVDDLFRRDAFFRRPGYERIVALVEPFGIGAFTLATKYWTAAERNTQLPPVEGLILWNRLIWLGAAMLLPRRRVGALFTREGKTCEAGRHWLMTSL